MAWRAGIVFFRPDDGITSPVHWRGRASLRANLHHVQHYVIGDRGVAASRITAVRSAPAKGERRRAMNPHEQRERANVIRENAFRRLNERIDDLAAAVDEEVAEKMVELRQLVARLMQAEHTELQHEVDASKDERFQLWRYASLSHRQIASFAALSFLGRLRWLLFGRVPPVFSEAADFSPPNSEQNTSDTRNISVLRREVL